MPIEKGATVIVATASPGEVRAAALRGGQLVDLAIERPGAPAALGDLYHGRVIVHAPAMAGSFVALGAGPDGFLPDSASDTGRGHRVGDGVVVRVTRAAQGGKGPRLRAADPSPDSPRAEARPAVPGRLARAPGAVARLSALHQQVAIQVDDPALFAALRPALGDRLALVPDAFTDAQEQLAALGEPMVALQGGGRLLIEPTSALVAIDVDLGGGAAGRSGKTATHRAANSAAVQEIARQIRLRSLGGPIVVDLAGMSPRGRQALAPAFESSLAEDPAAPRFLGFSALGLAEILRRRTLAPLHEILAGPHAAALAALRAALRSTGSARATGSAPARAPSLWVAPDVAAALQADRAALAQLESRCGRGLAVHVVPDLGPGRWRSDPP